MERGACATCGRKMYKTPAGWGTPSEWRHDSSGHAISWTPDKHLAGTIEVFEHQHRWSKPDKQDLKTCEVIGCESEVIDFRPEPATPPATDRERREQVSRLRGSSARGNRPSREPVSNPSD